MKNKYKICVVYTGRLEKTEASLFRSFKLYFQVTSASEKCTFCLRHTVSYKIKKLKLLRAKWPMQLEENLVSIGRSAVKSKWGHGYLGFPEASTTRHPLYLDHLPPWLVIPAIQPWAPPYHKGSPGPRPQIVTKEFKIRRRRRLRKRYLLAALNLMTLILSRIIRQTLAILFGVEF